jgi:hypothetical protein
MSMLLQRAKWKRFVPRYLDPASRLGEILFGLIMVLTVTLTAGLTASDGREGARHLLFAAIGCNIAWGIIDAVMYLMDCVTVRTGKVRLVQAVQSAPDAPETLELIRNEIEPELQELIGEEKAQTLSRAILKHLADVKVTKRTLTKDDLYGAVACFWLVFLSCLPAAVPFLVFSRPHFALRVSNFLLIGLLFLVGRKWAAHAGVNALAAGSALVAIGLALVGIAALLGG